jgi:hypothetical protein
MAGGDQVQPSLTGGGNNGPPPVPPPPNSAVTINSQPQLGTI